MRRILITISTIALLLSGCSVYKIDVQQGNTLDSEKVAQLETGMNKQQVQFLLGTAMLKDPFHPDRWDYVYTFTPGGGEMKKHHLTLFFENGQLVTIDKSDLNPDYMDNKARN
ncbi:MAG: outer membrane protein assembly factor BamE [Gammaproteobacteria bacterium]